MQNPIFKLFKLFKLLYWRSYLISINSKKKYNYNFFDFNEKKIKRIIIAKN